MTGRSQHPLISQELLRSATIDFLEAEWAYYNARDQLGTIQAHHVSVQIEEEILRRWNFLPRGRKWTEHPRNTLGITPIYWNDCKRAV